MAALHAYENKPAQWSLKFEVRPSLGTIYFRRFHYAKTADGGWECEKWTEDPEHPEHIDYDPDDNDSDDDLETLEEEERMAREHREGDGDDDEVGDLNADNELSIEELMAKYRALDAAQEAADADAGAGARKRARSEAGEDEGSEAGAGSRAKQLKNESGEAVAAGAETASSTASEPLTARSGDSPFAAGQGLAGGDRRFSILEYFSAENHEEDLEYGTRVTEPTPLRIGAEFQCAPEQIPAASAGFDSAELAASSCTLLWSPCPASREADCTRYSRDAVKGRERPSLPLEAALHILHELRYDTAAAAARFGDSYQGKVPFTLTERTGFERGLLAHGKNFLRISRDFIPTRTVKEIVSFYHGWKWTEYYDEFIARNWGYGPSKFRRKHMLEPSRDVESFDVQPIAKECLTSPVGHSGFETADCSPLDVAATTADYSLDVDAIT